MTNLYTYDYKAADKQTTTIADGWHGSGTKLPEDADLATIMDHAGLDYTVEKRPIAMKMEDGSEIILPDKRALVREDNGAYFGVVSAQWNPVQNIDALTPFEDFRRANDLRYEAGGTFRQGQHAWVLTKSMRETKLFAGDTNADTVSPYFLFLNPHQFGHSVQLREQATVFSCLNQVEPLFKKAKKLQGERYMHRGPGQFTADKATLTLGGAFGRISEFAAIAEELGSVKADRKQVEGYWRNVFNIVDPDTGSMPLDEREQRIERNQNRIDKLFLTATQEMPNAQCRAGTWWQYFQAATYTVDHRETINPDKRNQSAWMGVGAKRKQLALTMARELAKA